MSARQAAREVLDDFLPAYLGGGSVRVGLPLGNDEVAALRDALAAGGVTGEVAAARRRLAARIALPKASMELGAEEVEAVAVVHNLLALGDPALSGKGGRLLGWRKAARFTAALAETLPEPASPDASLAAHALVSPLVSARRVDALLKFWAGRKRYSGRPAPSRVQRLPRLRRVRVESEDVPAVTPGGDAEVITILRHLFRFSPVTSLLAPDRDRPPFRLDGLAACIADPDLCRGIFRHWLRAPDVADLGGCLVRALLARIHDPVDRNELSLWMSACYHLHVAAQHDAQLGGAPAPAPGGPGCVPTTEASRWHLAFFKLVHRGGEIFELPDAGSLGADLAARLAAYDAALKAVATQEEEREILEALRSRFQMVGFPGWPRRAAEPESDPTVPPEEQVTDEVVP